MKDHEQEMMREIASRMVAAGFEPMGMESAKAKLEQHLNGGISSARDRLRESARCEQTVLALNDLLNETQKNAMLLVQDNDRLRAELAELRKQPSAVPEAVAKDGAYQRCLRDVVKQLVLMMDDCEEHADGRISIDCATGADQFLRRIYDLLNALEIYTPDCVDEAFAAILSAADTEVKNG